MHERRSRGFQSASAGAVGVRPHDQSPDDWLGDISDEDWSENAAEHAERRRAASASQGLSAPADDFSLEQTADRPAPARPDSPSESRRAVIERRRLVAGLVLVVVLGLAVGIPVLLLRGGGEETVTPAVEPATTTPAPSEGGVSTPTTTTPETSPSTTTPTTTPSTPGASTFTLPEGTKLRLGEEADPAVVSELQEALTSAGYDPGPVDGTYGQQTEAAVVAFQQDNGLSADGVVGPETAAALNSPASTSPSTTTPSTSGASGFTLPEGTKLRPGEEGDPAMVSELQQTLTSAGYDPGPVDGTYGPRTEAAVVAFQQDNGLSADGVVGTETAAALNNALAG